ncbi:serine hydrolase [Herbiconiux moechotypicola]|uniref:Serine hydrolase n=2 Tax=Herbiconiux moechotypicola TaxID=637393 RepID=A0ABP5QIX9_9MICO
MRAALAGAATALALVLAGCTSTGGVGQTTATAVLDPVALPDTPVGEHAAWVVAALNGELDADQVRIAAPDRLARVALDEISPQELADVFEQLAAQGPWTPTAVQAVGSQAVVTLHSPTADALDLQLVLDADDRITGLLFVPSAAERVAATSWGELESAVEALAAPTRLVVTEVAAAGAADAASGPVFSAGTDPGDPLPSGSVFKLYVLGAVADAVAAGELAWNQELTLTDDVKSLPSGELQNEPAGTVVTVRDAAEAMISISDNTATDLLVQAVGPDAVERAFADFGQADPSANVPLLTTRALFQLGWGASEEETAAREAWNHADETQRRALLAALPTGPIDVEASAVTTLVWQEGLDWFTTADDLTAVHRGLQERAAAGEVGAPVREILAVNDGLGDAVFGERWPYVAFKGGSSVGVLAGSWYLERDDGRAFTVSIQSASDDPAALADQTGFFGQVADAVALLESE